MDSPRSRINASLAGFTGWSIPGHHELVDTVTNSTGDGGEQWRILARRNAYSGGIVSATNENDRTVKAWVNTHAVVMLVATAAVFVVESTIPVATAALLSFGYLLARHKRAMWSPAIIGRYAHQLTLLRFLLLCYATWHIADIDFLWLLTIFIANVLLDVVDGYIARRLDQATYFGMVFDREVDGIYVLAACLYFHVAAGTGAWILVPGVLPYAYRLVAWTMGNPAISGKKQPLAAFLAGVNFVLILIAVVVPGDARLAVLVLSTVLVTLSFLVSFRDLFRSRNESPVL
jgi:phosphatidylglycerophosphate synthase